MSMLVLDYCCCCFPLRPGCLVIGYLNLISSIILIAFAILALRDGIILQSLALDDGGASTILIAVSVIMLAFFLLFFFFNIALLIGLHKRKPRYVKAFLIYALIFLVIYLINFIGSIILGVRDAFSIIGKIIEIIFSSYFLLVIRSAYVRMLDSNFNSS